MFRAGSFPWLCPIKIYPTLPMVGLVLAGNPHFWPAPVAPCPLGSPDKGKGGDMEVVINIYKYLMGWEERKQS